MRSPASKRVKPRLYINAADLCLVTLRDIPLFDGAIPTKLIDYMACGKAVLCGIRGEAARIVDVAKAGVMFEPDNDEQLSELVAELLQDAARVERMGACGLAYVRSRFAAATMREQMESVLLAASKNIQSPEVVEGRLG
jgi:glycosyltransferase involved in cell wall biosynthesis